jgi:YbbR domain-containing protein
MIRWLVENVGLMLLALIIALAVWIAAEWEEDPIREDEFDQPIPVQVVNQPPDTRLVDGWQKQVRVRLRAPQSVWNQLSPEQFKAVIDLSPDLSPLEPDIYIYAVPVEVSVDVEPAALLTVEPEWIEIELEAIRERPVPVYVEIRGEPDLGYQAGEPIVVSDTVKVRGPASQVDQVRQAMTSISLRGARDTVAEEAAVLTPVDAEGKRVNGVVLDPERISVLVPVKQRSNFKRMTVRPEILGQPDPDYRVTNVRINPSEVMVIGSSPIILDNLPGFLTTVPISIEGRTEDVVERLPLELPPGVATVNLEQPAVQVTIEIEPFLGSVTVTRTVTYQGLQPNLTPVASPEVVEVILSGPLPRLSTLLPEDVRVILDLSGWRLGDQDQLEPVVVPPEEITVDSIIPPVIQVEIVRKPTPTPAP